MSYRQLTLDDRERIEFLHSLGYSQAYIARRLEVHRSTISNELKRNSVRGRYSAHAAQVFTLERKERPKGYLLRKRPKKVRRNYVVPYKNMSWFDREIRLWKKEYLRPGRKKKEWRFVRKDSCQFSRLREDERLYRYRKFHQWKRRRKRKARGMRSVSSQSCYCYSWKFYYDLPDLRVGRRRKIKRRLFYYQPSGYRPSYFNSSEYALSVSRKKHASGKKKTVERKLGSDIYEERPAAFIASDLEIERPGSLSTLKAPKRQEQGKAMFGYSCLQAEVKEMSVKIKDTLFLPAIFRPPEIVSIDLIRFLPDFCRHYLLAENFQPLLMKRKGGFFMPWEVLQLARLGGGGKLFFGL